jgi:hypothetical protein
MTWKKATKAYSAKVLATQGSALAGYWPLDEVPGSTVGRNLKVPANPTGTFGSGWSFVSDTGLDGPGKCALFSNGSTSQVDATIASYNGATCAIMAWLKVPTAVWSDGTARLSFGPIVDGSNLQMIRRPTGNNKMQAIDTSTGTTVVSELNPISDAGWFCVVANFTPTTVLMYVNGVAVGSATTRVATFTGSATVCRFGFTGATWSGYMADCAMWAGVSLTTAEIANLAKRMG